MARLLLFAAAREAAGCREAEVAASSVGEALKVAAERFGPGFARILPMCSILVEERVVASDRVWEVAVDGRTEIAVLPPVSGGAPASGRRRGAGSVARMMDVAEKPETVREAVAVCRLVARPKTRERILSGALTKGDAVAAATVAGTLAAKRVPDLIPMCHPVRTTFVEVSCSPAGRNDIEVRATVRGTDRTGFEMEALTAAAVAALTLYDMAKADDPAMRVEGLRLLSKSGGKSGEWRAP